MQFKSIPAVTLILVQFALPLSAQQASRFDDEGPFREGEGFGPPATCDTIGDWIDRVPDYDGRISMTIEGAIVDSHWDGALAYLIMCQPQGIQVMCVTYYPREASDEIVKFAGGYNRVGERQIMLDPCLVYQAGDGADVGE